MQTRRWRCGNGHTFTWGDEAWHTRQLSQAYSAEWDCLIPMYCTADFDDGDPCMDSSSLIMIDPL